MIRPVKLDKMHKTIVADPPWPFGDKLPGPKRGAAKHYNTMSLAAIMAYLGDELSGRIAPDARLFLWRVASMQAEAIAVMDAWGFSLKAEMVWVKTLKSRRWHGAEGELGPVPVLNMGMGRQVRMAHETCLIGVRGRLPVLDKGVRSVFFAPISKHSAKPEVFSALVERLSPGPYLELFARRERPGWTCIGDELEATR